MRTCLLSAVLLEGFSFILIGFLAPPRQTCLLSAELLLGSSLTLSGFALLFAVNALVELLILPQLGFENTPDNDVYFQSWWVLLGLWFVFGNSILTKIDTERASCGSADRRVDSPACAEPDQL